MGNRNGLELHGGRKNDISSIKEEAGYAYLNE